VSVSQITMTTGWLLLLLAVASSQCSDGQATSDEVIHVLLAEIQKDMEGIQDKQQQILQRLQPPQETTAPEQPPTAPDQPFTTSVPEELLTTPDQLPSTNETGHRKS